MNFFLSNKQSETTSHMQTAHHDFKDNHNTHSSHGPKTPVAKTFANKNLLVLILVVGLIAGAYLVQNGNFDVRNLASTNKVDLSLLPSTMSVSPNQPFTVLVNATPNGHQVTSLDLTLTANNVTVTSISEINSTVNPPAPFSVLNKVLPENPDDPNRAIIAVTCETTCPTLTQTGTILQINALAGSPGSGSINFDITNTLAASIGNGNTNVIGDVTGITVTIAGASPTPVPSSPVSSPTPPPGNKKPIITTGPNLGAVTKNQAMNKPIVATDADNDAMTMTATPATLPPGVSLIGCQQSGNTLTCQLTGTPTVSGQYNIAVTVKDIWNASVSKTFKLRVN